LRELTASQLIAIVPRSDTGSHNRLDLIQSFVPPHCVCNGYVFQKNNTKEIRGHLLKDVRKSEGSVTTL